MSDRPLDDYRLPVDPEDLLTECDVSYFLASGPGGQHRNRNRTAVRLRHRPSGLVVIGRRQRSRRQNLRDALGRLHERLAEEHAAIAGGVVLTTVTDVIGYMAFLGLGAALLV